MLLGHKACKLFLIPKFKKAFWCRSQIIMIVPFFLTISGRTLRVFQIKNSFIFGFGKRKSLCAWSVADAAASALPLLPAQRRGERARGDRQLRTSVGGADRRTAGRALPCAGGQLQTRAADMGVEIETITPGDGKKRCRFSGNAALRSFFVGALLRAKLQREKSSASLAAVCPM